MCYCGFLKRAVPDLDSQVCVCRPDWQHNLATQMLQPKKSLTLTTSRERFQKRSGLFPFDVHPFLQPPRCRGLFRHECRHFEIHWLW